MLDFFKIGFLTIFIVASVNAGEVKIMAVDLYNNNDNSWLVKVTLSHQDSGWDHYADGWQVVDSNGNVLGDRVLHHPHVNEQSFTRNLAGVNVPDGMNIIYIKAHDKVHGWTKKKLKIDLNMVNGRHLRIEAE